MYSGNLKLEQKMTYTYMYQKDHFNCIIVLTFEVFNFSEIYLIRSLLTEKYTYM